MPVWAFQEVWLEERPVPAHDRAALGRKRARTAGVCRERLYQPPDGTRITETKEEKENRIHPRRAELRLSLRCYAAVASCFPMHPQDRCSFGLPVNPSVGPRTTQ